MNNVIKKIDMKKGLKKWGIPIAVGCVLGWMFWDWYMGVAFGWLFYITQDNIQNGKDCCK